MEADGSIPSTRTSYVEILCWVPLKFYLERRWVQMGWDNEEEINEEVLSNEEEKEDKSKKMGTTVSNA